MNITDNKFLENLTENEKQEVLKILGEMSETGTSVSLNKYKYADYDEIPVDIMTFLKDPKYLGNAWHTSDGKFKLFDAWQGKLQEIFPDNVTTNFNNVIFSGARGLGKSEIAVACGLYLMYRVMCLKDPRATLNLKPTEKIAFAFMNITEALAIDIGVSKFQATVQMSPWFIERGTITGKNDLIWNPPDYINIIVGSQPRHVIGQAIYYCLDGDTIIKTTDGDKKISSLLDKSIQVYSLDDTGNICISDTCTVKLTAESSEEYEFELEDGSIIKCTPQHRFLLKDGSYKEAQYLTLDDELEDIFLI